MYPQLFSKQRSSPSSELIKLSKEHLTKHDLLGKNHDTSSPVGFDLPKLQGSTLDEHFFKLGMDAAEPYLSIAKKYALANAPPKPRKWVRRSGWTKYSEDGTVEGVNSLPDEALTFDVETMYKETQFACMACAVSSTAWYAWISPWLLGETESPRHLIPIGDKSTHRILVGHNIGYDRARILEEYDLQQSKSMFLDTMSLHVAVNGMCSRQRPTWVKHRKDRELRDKIAKSKDGAELAVLLESRALTDDEEDLWVGRSSVNSLRDVAKFHCGITIDKARREYFGELDRPGIRERLDELLDYCAADVEITHRVYKKVFPLFTDICPHPVSFAALRHLSSEILPVNKSWEEYLRNAEATYRNLVDGVTKRLVSLADKALDLKEDENKYSSDPWLRQLDWSGQAIKMVKGKNKNDPPRPSARQKKPGMPKWYKELFANNDATIALTVRTRIAPILLRMCWDGNPLVWSDKHGWTFKVPPARAAYYAAQAVLRVDMSEEENLVLRNDVENVYFKLPHKDGPKARCTSPLTKGYQQFFETGVLSSEYPYAREALEMNASCSYWISARDRITSQLVVYQSDINKNGEKSKNDEDGEVVHGKDECGFILPQVIPMGTITRRAVENTWLTASNAKVNRVGSELKAMVKAPPGYCFVGADVDSQELWIASLVGDAQFKLHGGNAIGFMTLEGNKAAGTDLHSHTASILGISRNDAKVFNYGRIYGAGLNFAATLLRQFNPSLTLDQASDIANKLYAETKGRKKMKKVLHERSFWRGGTESVVFNTLEDFAEQERPRTPVLAAGITEALMRRYISKGAFMTSRINWAIQSSGVDYLHLLIVSMDHLIRRFRIDARLAITVHDEIRYLCRWTDRYRAAMALQVANVWTRAMFSQQMGIDDLPQSCAYFSAIDIDSVLRKEVDTSCVTPSHPHPIPPGESLDIEQLLDKGRAAAYLDPDIGTAEDDAAESAVVGASIDAPQPQRYAHLYTPREPVMVALRAKKEASGAEMPFLKAQLSSDERELNEIVREVRIANAAADAASAASIGAALNAEEQQQQQQNANKKSRKKTVQRSRSKKVVDDFTSITTAAYARTGSSNPKHANNHNSARQGSFPPSSSSSSSAKTTHPADRYQTQHPSYPYRYRYRPAPKLVPVDPDRFVEGKVSAGVGAGD